MYSIFRVRVKSNDTERNADGGESGKLELTDAEVRKRGYQSGFDTQVVHAVNDEYYLLDNFFSSNNS